MAEIIEARVIQKVGTEAEWLANPLPLLDGEAAIVRTGDGTPVNLKFGDGGKTFAELPYFIDYSQAAYVEISSNSLPTPTQDVGYGFANEGTYTFGASSYTVPDGHWGMFSWDGTTWSLKDMGVLPVDPNAIKRNEIDVSGGVVGFDTFSTLTVIDADGSNLIDLNTAEFGYIQSSNGLYATSTNWVRIPYSVIPEEVKGKYMTVKRLAGSVGNGGNIVSFRGESDVYMSSDSIAGTGVSTPTELTVLVPETAVTWGFAFINATGISDPVDNPYTQGFSVKSEDITNVLLDSTKLSNPNGIEFSNPITEEGNGAVPAKEVYPIKATVDSVTIASKNIVNFNTMFEAGYYNASGAPTNGVNWLRTKPVYFSQEVVDRLELGETLHLAIQGGGSVGATASYATFFDSTNAVISNNTGVGSATFPSVVQIPANAKGYKGTIANAVGVGSPENILTNQFTKSYQAEIGDEPTEFIPFGESILNNNKLPRQYDTSEVILIKQTETLFYIFFHIGGANNKWFRINLVRQVSPSKFVDVWRLNEGWKCIRTDDFTFNNNGQVVNEGVYENAIYTSGTGYTDALGSSHGWEMLEASNFFLDGKELDLSTLTTAKGKYFTFNTKTSFKSPDGVSNVGTSFKKWSFFNGIFRIKNTMTWLSTMNLGGASGNSFIGMLSILRKATAGIQVTHTGYSNDDGTPYDISEAGFTNSLFSDKNNPRRTLLVTWGDDIKSEMEILSRKIVTADGTTNPNGLPNAGMFVQNTTPPEYNKNYHLFGSMVVNNGDMWECEVEYRLSNI